MADDRHYVGGDFYRICDRTGFKVRAGRTMKQWNDIIVRDESFENRQPQDFVRGRPDPQFVPEPRPRTFPFMETGAVFPVPNIIAQSNQQALGWPGARTANVSIAGVAPNATLLLPAGSVDAGTYVSSPNPIDLGSVQEFLLYTSASIVGQPRGVLSIPDVGNVIPSYYNAGVAVAVQMSLDGGPFMRAANTNYRGRTIILRLAIDTLDENISAFIYGFNYQIGAVS